MGGVQTHVCQRKTTTKNDVCTPLFAPHSLYLPFCTVFSLDAALQQKRLAGERTYTKRARKHTRQLPTRVVNTEVVNNFHGTALSKTFQKDTIMNTTMLCETGEFLRDLLFGSTNASDLCKEDTMFYGDGFLA